jgi:hypothetical protein
LVYAVLRPRRTAQDASVNGKGNRANSRTVDRAGRHPL